MLREISAGLPCREWSRRGLWAASREDVLYATEGAACSYRSWQEEEAFVGSEEEADYWGDEGGRVGRFPTEWIRKGHRRTPPPLPPQQPRLAFRPLLGVCLFGSTTNCSANQPNCYIGSAVFNISTIPKIKAKGCVESDSCNFTISRDILGVGYSVQRICCNTNQCNWAGAIQLHLTLVLGAALVAIWSNVV
ncbi:hypothetical protein UPYG_G00340850 [Umbra pygmaea]|uniref:UPAR/Ly6 domain-containing protein n=1 Tax=Umbra pygmaea TaxID=75934 RepID=A0ABD0WE48_UMBPY